MSLAFNEMQFSVFMQFLKREKQHMPIRRAACIIGQQMSGSWERDGLSVRMGISSLLKSPDTSGWTVLYLAGNLEMSRHRILFLFSTPLYPATHSGDSSPSCDWH